MKNFKDYIEEQRINEDGLRDTLIGTIIMKLLGTGLDWLGGTVKWIANSFKGASKEGLNLFNNINRNDFERYIEKNRYKYKYNNIPTSEREYIEFMDKNFIRNDNNSLKEIIAELENFKQEFNASNNWFVIHACMTIVNYCNKNGNFNEEKGQEALSVLNKIKSKYYNKVKEDAKNTINKTYQQINKHLKNGNKK